MCRHIKFALLDHITSPTAVLLPVGRLCSICRKHGVAVMVDGAHAPGNMLPNLDIPAVGADWYTGNLHKWCFTPKGSAFLWVAKPMQDIAQGVVISHAFASPDWQVRKRILYFAPYYRPTKNDHFTKTGSGQTYCRESSTQKESGCVFLQERFSMQGTLDDTGEKTALVGHFLTYIKTIILPRQTKDKHRIF